MILLIGMDNFLPDPGIDDDRMAASSEVGGDRDIFIPGLAYQHGKDIRFYKGIVYIMNQDFTSVNLLHAQKNRKQPVPFRMLILYNRCHFPQSI